MLQYHTLPAQHSEIGIEERQLGRCLSVENKLLIKTVTHFEDTTQMNSKWNNIITIQSSEAGDITRQTVLDNPSIGNSWQRLGPLYANYASSHWKPVPGFSKTLSTLQI